MKITNGKKILQDVTNKQRFNIIGWLAVIVIDMSVI